MITNPQNEQIKDLARLHLRKGRKEAGAFLIEGVRFVEEALKAGVKPEKIVVSPKLQETDRGRELLGRCRDLGCPVLEVEQRVLAKVADTENPQGIVAVVPQQHYSWPELLAETGSAGKVFWLVVDGVQDPGNLGTIVRTAHAAGISGICLTPGTVDVYNSKALRSTMGSVFHLPVLQGIPPQDILTEVKSRDWQVVVGDITADREYFQVNFQKETLLVVGSETQGPSREFIDRATHRIRISMPGGAESLNVAVAAGILLFEGVRQTRFSCQ